MKPGVWVVTYRCLKCHGEWREYINPSDLIIENISEGCPHCKTTWEQLCQLAEDNAVESFEQGRMKFPHPKND